MSGNKFVYFTCEVAVFSPESINAEWHCAYVFKPIIAVHSCNASLGIVFMCNQMRRMSGR